MENHKNRKKAIKKLRLLTYTSKSNIDTFRAKIEKEYDVTFLPNKVELSESKYGNVICDVLSPELYSTNRIVLYIHGGCFVGGSRASYRNFCSSIASKSFSRVVIPEYRLAPAYPCPSAIEDVQAAFKALFAEEQVACSLNSESGKIVLPEIVIMADGSAASIACSLIFNLRDRFRSCIKHVILFSPWLDVSPASSILSQKKCCDEVMSADVIRKSCAEYTYESNTATASLSPLLAEDDVLQNFPPVFIQMGEKEILLPDAKKFRDRLIENGNECVLDVWPDMMYMFQMADKFIFQSHRALDKIGKVVTDFNAGEEAVQIDNKPVLESSIKSES